MRERDSRPSNRLEWKGTTWDRTIRFAFESKRSALRARGRVVNAPARQNSHGKACPAQEARVEHFKRKGTARPMYSHSLNDCVDTMCRPPGISLPITPIENIGFSGLDIGAELRSLSSNMAVFSLTEWGSWDEPF